ncbi:hypothetical protein RHSIM_Rhsim08G0140900 [Rhododendron simsii]|uniref:non-specific serine/threonine protein kinase n=1 Tax=Rhododendron simsii TaxID=118357 RepID=A0A834GNH8_RHOSS|nr:hypothetical protein RHSIM_Rhsim08G0140900 [Rhododendron simsii]
MSPCTVGDHDLPESGERVIVGIGKSGGGGTTAKAAGAEVFFIILVQLVVVNLGGGAGGTMGCSFSGLNALYDAVNGGGDVWINKNRFRILRQLGEGGFAYVYLVKEVLPDSSGLASKFTDASHLSDDGTYAMKKVLIQNTEQLELVREEIRVSSLFSHPNLLPLLDHAIIAVKPTQEGSWKNEAYLLFPVHLDGTLLDNANAMKAKKEFFSTSNVLHTFRQLCSGLKHMHNFDPPYAHNDVKPGNVLITHRKGQPPLTILMDFGSARPARKQIRSRTEALQLQAHGCMVLASDANDRLEFA